MAYFPFFMDLEGRKGLIAGGGATALRKVQKLMPYGPELTVASPELCPELRDMPGLTLLERPFAPELLEGRFFAVAATDDRELNRQIAALCRERGILVNVVDDREECSFLFPALVKRGALSVGVSTGGASPSAAVWLKEQIAALLPEHTEEILDWLDGQRAAVRERVPEEARRSAALRALFLACLERGRPLDGEETEEIFDREDLL